jgi:ElaB/YqjD/DUF883 family membrane-anchored ribosome-binding protein
MAEPLSCDRLAEIRDRVHNATPGPWGVGNRTEIALDAKQDGPGCFSYTVKLATVIEDDDRQDDVYYLNYYLNPTTQPRTVASAEDDALFIAHTRQDVEDLLAEVDRLKAELAEMESAAADWAARLAELRSKAETRLVELADIERTYRKVGNKAGAARQDAAAAEIRSLFGIEWKPGGAS